MESPSPSTYLILVGLLLLSAFFSASETAISSVNKMRLKGRAEDGDKKARAVLRLVNDFDGTLSAILIGNNVVNIASASLATLLATALLGDKGAAVATASMTVLVLVFGEIVPKSLAKENADQLSGFLAGPLQWIKTAFKPLVWLFVQLKRLFTGRRSNELNVQPSVTEEELKTIIDTVEEEGVLDSQETEIIHSVIEFDNTTVQEILTPRVDMVAVALDGDVQELLAVCCERGVSRVPVYEGTIDHVVGVVHAKDLLACLAGGKQICVQDILRPIFYVYRTKRINTLLSELRRQKQHMAIVTDEHGGTLGLVTMEDILEELVGEIWDESDEAQTPIRRHNEQCWLVDGDANLEDLFEAIGYDARHFDGDYNTVSGWMLHELGHIPTVGESITHENLTLEITAMEDQRIETVQVTVTTL